VPGYGRTTQSRREFFPIAKNVFAGLDQSVFAACSAGQVDTMPEACIAYGNDHEQALRPRAGSGMNILVVDDHAVIRAGLRELLMSTIGAACWEAESAGAALAILAERQPDVALLDLALPGLGGLTILPRLRELGVRTLVLSMNTDPIYVTRALQAGALGYVSKNVAPDELVTAIHAVAEGRRYIEQRLAQELAVQGTDVRHGLPRLTEREMEIMRLLAAGRSYMEISNVFGVSYKTVANTAGQLRTKLGVARTADLIRLAVEIRRDGQPPRST